MPKQQINFIPCLLLLLSFSLYFSLISKGPYHLDCLELAIQAEKTLTTGKLHYLFGPGYPLVVILGAFCIFILKLFGINDPVMGVNLMSAVTGALSVPVFYTLVKKMLDSRTALLSAVAYGLTPIIMESSTYGKSHAPTLLFLFLGLNFLMDYRQNYRRKDIILSAIALGFMGAARLQDLILVGPSIFYFCCYTDWQKSKNITVALKNILLMMILTGITVIAFGAMIWAHYDIVYIGHHLYEGWYKGSTITQIYDFQFFRLYPKGTRTDAINNAV